MQKDLVAVKKEEVKVNPAPSRLRATKGKGKEPIRQAAGNEASDPPEDESMDSDNLFGTFGPVTATNCISHTNLPCSLGLSL